MQATAGCSPVVPWRRRGAPPGWGLSCGAMLLPTPPPGPYLRLSHPSLRTIPPATLRKPQARRSKDKRARPEPEDAGRCSLVLPGEVRLLLLLLLPTVAAPPSPGEKREAAPRSERILLEGPSEIRPDLLSPYWVPKITPESAHSSNTSLSSLDSLWDSLNEEDEPKEGPGSPPDEGSKGKEVTPRHHGVQSPEWLLGMSPWSSVTSLPSLDSQNELQEKKEEGSRQEQPDITPEDDSSQEGPQNSLAEDAV
nr:uncharacterized protein LOC118075333 [Zootoca vivipara]